MQAERIVHTAIAERSGGKRMHGPSLVRSDEELLARYAETGNREAFEELVHRNERELYGYLRRFVGDAQLAEDAFQATFLQVHLKCRQFVPGRRLRPWLFAIAANQAVDLLRRNRRHKAVSLNTSAGDGGNLLETDEADPTERLRLSEDHQRIHAAVERLPAKIRQVLVLVVYKGLTYRTAAKTLGIPIGTVKSRMNKAIHSLYEMLITTRHEVSTHSGTRRPSHSHSFSSPRPTSSLTR